MPDPRHVLAAGADDLLEATVVGSFSRLGFELRSRMEEWTVPRRLDGKVIVVTGASSGIGRAAALALAQLGAGLVLVGRDEARLAATQRAATASPTRAGSSSAPLDLVDPDAVGWFAERLAASRSPSRRARPLCRRTVRGLPEGSRRHRVDLGHARSCAISPQRPALPPPRRASSSVIVTVSSGGMYTQRFDLAHLEVSADDYRGATAYARAKRAQVVLAHEWARRWGPDGVASYAMHPGWVDTPGLATGLPRFAHLGPLLRTPGQGADT